MVQKTLNVGNLVVHTVSLSRSPARYGSRALKALADGTYQPTKPFRSTKDIRNFYNEPEFRFFGALKRRMKQIFKIQRTVYCYSKFLLARIFNVLMKIYYCDKFNYKIN